MILNQDGAPITSGEVQEKAETRMAELMPKVIQLFSDNKVGYHEGADIGMNLIINYALKQPNNALAIQVLQQMHAAIDFHAKRLLSEKQIAVLQ